MQRRISWKTIGTLAATAVAVAGMSFSKPAMSADHEDSKTLLAEPSSDINDVYSWMDGDNVVLGMTVFPFADATAKFSDSVKYVFHVSSMATFGAPTPVDTDVICTFSVDQKASCWVGTKDYVTGDASATTGMTSTSGKTKVFAGRVEDPFHFNLVGFKDAVTAAEQLVPDSADAKTPAGCFTLKQNETGPIAVHLNEISSSNSTTKSVADDFVTAQGLAILVSVDKSLVSAGGPILAVWGATTN